MDEQDIVRSLLLRMGHGVPASAPIARAMLEWAAPHREWLTGTAPIEGEAMPDWNRLLMTDAGQCSPSAVLQIGERLARLLVLPPFDATLLTLIIACDRLPRVGALVRVATAHGHDLPLLLGELAGGSPADAVRRTRQSQVLRLGLASFRCNRQGQVEVDIGWTLERLLDRAPNEDRALVDMLVGARQTARLDLDDFEHVPEVDFLTRLIAGAIDARAAGINILIHGPPGTGKTELARTLSAAASVTLHAVGEVDDDGDEPTRHERVCALQLAQRISARGGGAALLFDEMEDLIGDARSADGDWFAGRQGSKLFVNRMLEVNPVPVLWTTNAIGNIDAAILRRMSFVLKLGLPSPRAGQRMLARIAREEAVVPDSRFAQLIEAAPEAATVLRVATRAGRLAGEADGGMHAAEALVRALRGGALPLDGPGTIDLDFFETDIALAPLFERIAGSDQTDVSLLLTGPPGTGKTALAHHLARRLDRPLVVKRASDLLSKWVGETEAQIAEAFAEARRRDGILLFDEADSLLFDRTMARTSWEVGQVNELLTWLDRHPLPVVAATNHGARLDPATLRRFVFKIDLQPLGARRAAQAFVRFFGMPAPAGLGALANLTPGDFAIVVRQLRHAPTDEATEILARLSAEALAKPTPGGRVGF